MIDNIRGKVIVITGASSGLGEATARHLSASGAIVVLGARRQVRIDALAAELRSHGAAAMSVATDVTDRHQVHNLVAQAIAAYGHVDVMLNNAGLMPHSPLDRVKVDDWDRMVDVNIKGVLYGIAAVLPHMIDRKAGHIINVSSVAGHKVRTGSTVYSATKHAVRAISEGLRQEVKPYGLRTTIISPGAVATELPESITEPMWPTMSASSTRSRYLSMRSRVPWLMRSASRTTSTSMKSCSGPRSRNTDSNTVSALSPHRRCAGDDAGNCCERLVFNFPG